MTEGVSLEEGYLVAASGTRISGQHLKGGVLQSVVAGTNVTVDSTDPSNPIVSASGGGGSGIVQSVVAGANVTVDSTDPAHPIVAASGGGSGGLTLISRQVLAAPAASVTFSSIPNSYSNLQIRAVGGVSDASQSSAIFARFNGDSGFNYNYEYSQAIAQSAGTTGKDGAWQQTSLVAGWLNGAGGVAGTASAFVATILGYARTAFHKTLLGMSYTVIVAAGMVLAEVGGNWANTAAISSITLTPASGGNFITGTVIELYGEA